MTINKEIIQQKQIICRYEKELVINKIKLRKAETRYKIELGGLVVKSGIHKLSMSVILGALHYSLELLEEDSSYLNLFESKGKFLFSKK